MRQKAAQQAMKKNFILYKGHTGWKIKTRIFGTLLVSLSAVAIAESVSAIDVHAATAEETPTADVSPSSTPKMGGSAVLPKKTSEPAPENESEEDVSEEETNEEEAPADEAPASAATKTTIPEVESTNINDTSDDSTYQTLTPGQQVDVSKSGESTDGTVHLSADQIKDHFTASVNDQDTSDNSGGSANTHPLSINDKGEVTLTSNDPHPYVDGDGSTTQQTGHQAAHVAFEHAIDFGHDFSMTGALGIGSNPKGADSVGIIFAKGDATAALGGKSGRALGLGTLKNAFGFVYDNQHDSFDPNSYAVADPGTTDYFGWRTTDNSGELQGDTSTGVVDAGKLSLNDRTTNPFNNFTMTYDSKSKVLTVTLGGHDFTRTITDTTSGYSISIAASTGKNTNNYAVRIDSFTYTPKTANVDVNFTSQTTTPLSTTTAKTAAPVLANVGDTVSVFSSAEAAKRAVAADSNLNPDLITVLPTDSAGNVYVVDGSQAGSDTGTVHYINNDKDAADGAYYSYIVTGAADQKLAIPVSLTYKATITPVDQATGKAIPGIDPVVVNAVSGKSTVVQIPGFTPTTVTLPAPEDGQTTVAYNLPIDMSTTKTAATTTDDVANPIAHYYTASGETVDGKPVKSSVVAVGTNQSITDALNSQLADGKTAGVTSDDYYWSTVPNASGTDSTDETNPQDSGSILLPTQATLDSWTQKANDNQTKAEQVQKDAQSIYDTFVAKDGLSQDQKDAAKKLLDSVNNFAQQVSDANAQAKASFTAAEAATDPATIFSDSQDGYKAISGMSDSMDSLASFETDLDNMKTTTEGSLATFVSVTAPYGTETLPFPDVTFGKDFGADVTAEQKQGFNNPDFYYYVSSADLNTPVTPTDAGLYYFKLTDKGRAYLKSLTTNANAGLYMSSTLTITAAEVQPTIKNATVVYGGDDGKLPEITGSFGSQLANDENPVTQSDFEITDAAGNPIDLDKLQANGDYTIRYTAAAQTRLASNKNFDFGDKLADTTATLTVTKRPIAVVAQNTGKTYGVKTDPELTLTDTATDGLVNGDALSALGVNLTRVSGEDAGSYAISGTGTSDNYDVTVTPGTFTISAAKVTPTIKGMSVVYGGVDGNLPEITWSLGSDQVNAAHPVNQADFEIVDNGTGKTVAVNQLQAGGDYTIRYTAAEQTALKADHNYDFGDFGTAQLTVSPKTITVAAQPTSKTYGTPDPELVLTDSSKEELVNGDVLSDLDVSLARDTSQEDAGTYEQAIKGSASGTNKNYTVTVTSGTFTITPAEVTPTIQGTSVVYGGADGKLPEFTGSLGSDKANADHPITQDEFEVVDAKGNPVAVNQLQAGGDYTIRYTAATQTALKADKNYTFGDFGTAKLAVTPKEITVTAKDADKVYGASDPAFELTDDSKSELVNNDQLSDLDVSLTRDTSEEDVGTYANTITGSASGANTNYKVTVTSGTFTITSAVASVKVADAQMTYGDALPTLTATVSVPDNAVSQTAFEIIDNATGKPVATTDLQAGGNYTIQLTSTAKVQLAQKNGNYDFTDFGTGTLTVAKRPVTIQVANQKINAGDANPQNTVTLTKGTFKDGETVADLKLTYGEPTNPVVGTYAITADNGNPNYDVTVVPGQLKVLGKDVDEVTGTVTITEKDSADNVIKIDKQWKDGSETIYTYDPTTKERNVSEQKNGKEVDSQPISPESAKVTLSDGTGENTSTVVVLDPETNQPMFEHDTTQTANVDGTTTTITTDEKGNVVKVVKQWPDGHETTYTYDPMDGTQVVVEQKDGQTVGPKTIDAQTTQATLTSGDDSETVQTTVNVENPGAAPTFEHDTTQTTHEKSGDISTTKDAKGTVIKVMKEWADGDITTYTYDPVKQTGTVTEQKDGEQVDHQTITADALKVTLSNHAGGETVVDAGQLGTAPTLAHYTTEEKDGGAGNTTTTTKDADGNVVKVVQQWADGDSTAYTYDPVNHIGTVTEQKDGKQVDHQTITADAPKVTLSNHAGGETVVDAGQLGTAPILAHYTTEETNDGAGNVTATTKDTDGNVVKVVQQWADGDTTTYTYDPVDHTGSVTEQKDGQQLDQHPIDTDSTTTLSAGTDVKTIVKTGQPGTAPTFKHETTQTTTDKYGTVTETTKDAKGNVIKVTKQWVDGDSTVYTYDPATGKQVVTEQKGDQTIDQQPIGGKTTQATLTNNESSDKTIQTIVSAPKPGEAPTFEHNTTLVTPEKSGDIATTKDDKGNIIRVTKQWPDGGSTTYTYNPVTGTRTVTEEKNGKQVDQQTLDLDDPDTSEVTLSDGAGGKVTVKLSQADAMPTFAHYPAVPSVATDVSTEDAQKAVKITKQWNDGLKVIYTYDPATGERSIREFRDGALIEHRTIEPGTSLAVLPDGKGGSTIIKFGESGATVSFTRQLADKAGSRKKSSRKSADSAKRKNTSKRTAAVTPLSGSAQGQGDMKLVATNEGNAGDMTVTGPESQQQSGQQQTQLPQTGQKDENFLVQLGAILLGLLAIPFIRRRSH